jgi:hypothetical protein
MSRRRGALLVLALLAAAFHSAGAGIFARPSAHGGGVLAAAASARVETFVGPFANWLCAKTLASGSCGAAAGGYGIAAGDGATDDTAALQASLSALSSTHPVLWIPAGTYKIASPTSTACASTCASGASSITVASGSHIAAGMQINAAFAFIGTLTNGSTQITGLPSAAPIAVGQAVNDNGNVHIPGGTTITAYAGGTTATMSNAAQNGGVTEPIEFYAAGIPFGDFVASSYTPGSTTVPLANNCAPANCANTTAALTSVPVQFSLAISKQLYVSVIGAAPSTTSLCWAGGIGGTMLSANGMAYSRVDRLTFDGAGSGCSGSVSAGVAIDQSWQNTASYADTSNEYADDVVTSAGIGFRCGFFGFQCSEIALLRDSFSSAALAGVGLFNFNALDVWCWYCTFQNDYYGITNNVVGRGDVNGSPAGNFHVMNSKFSNSTLDDIFIGPAGEFNIRNNYSSGANRFIFIGGSCSPNIATMQGNTILDTTQPDAIVWSNGPEILLDNIIRSANASQTMAVVRNNACNPSDILSMGNTFTIGSSIDCTLNTGASPVYNPNGPCHSANDQIVTRGTVNPSPPTLPSTPANIASMVTVYEEAAGRTAAQIQADINSAAALNNGSTVHLQAGCCSIASTLTVPANDYVQLIGDGGYTHLTWTGSSGTNPIFDLAGPSNAVIRDMIIDGNAGAADGIHIDSADQAGGLVFGEELIIGGSDTVGLSESAGLSRTLVELHDVQYPNNIASGSVSVSISGSNPTAVFLGATSSDYLSYGISGTPKVTIEGIWNDAAAGSNQILALAGAGSVVYSTSASNMPGCTTCTVPHAFALAGFTGNFALSGVAMGGYSDLSVTGSASGGEWLGVGNVGPINSPPGSIYYADSTSPPDNYQQLLGQTVYPSSTVSAISETCSPAAPCPGNATLTAAGSGLVQQINTLPTMPATVTPNVTSVRLYRLTVSGSATGILVH